MKNMLRMVHRFLKNPSFDHRNYKKNDVFLSTGSVWYDLASLKSLQPPFKAAEHKILISGLEHCVIFCATAQRYQTYLSGRSFCAGPNYFRSSSAPLSGGVPQGSILKSGLFFFGTQTNAFDCNAEDRLMSPE